MDRRTAIQGLLDHPQYLQLRSDNRLNIVRKIQGGLPLSIMLLLLDAHHWVETGLIIGRKNEG